MKLSGTAALVDEGADAQIDRLSKKYTGRDVYASRQPGERRVSVRITPDRILSRGLDAEGEASLAPTTTSRGEPSYDRCRGDPWVALVRQRARSAPAAASWPP